MARRSSPSWKVGSLWSTLRDEQSTHTGFRGPVFHAENGLFEQVTGCTRENYRERHCGHKQQVPSQTLLLQHDLNGPVLEADTMGGVADQRL